MPSLYSGGLSAYRSNPNDPVRRRLSDPRCGSVQVRPSDHFRALTPDLNDVSLSALSHMGDVLEEVLKWMINAVPKNDRLAREVGSALAHGEKAERQLARRSIGW